MNKNIKAISLSMLVSIVMGIFAVETIFNDNSIMFQVLLSILGLCLTSYTFVLVPIQNVLKYDCDKDSLVISLLSEYKDNMLLIFFVCVILVIIDFIYKVDFPLLSNPTNIDFGLFKIISLKRFFKVVLENFLCILSLYSFYDMMQSIFILVKNSIIKKN